ncbi:cleavage and polyadenylation specificity factor subunit 1 isoform X1 [Hydra vulgaris]|uniref:cleavage and polyadenylation specificity factor subunit 1 isoform X1 n=1 Tax=Hydra vulgaris TaxID=6087 RepID=UPI001F5EC2E2|nr:cleavage and polyadenylation specificity factor subunit 1 isoform X1 [Hydra vulgaris]
MHSIFKEIHPPTVVDHAVRCYFFDSREVNLVTAGGQRLNVYRLCDADMVVSDGDQSSKIVDSVGKRRLELLASFTLFGNIINMQVVRLGSNVRDSLLLAFKHAKLSIVEFDPLSHDLKTDSMHYFENDEFKGGLSHNIYLPLVRVDPEQRCACMLIYNRHLVVLPFKHDIKLDESEELSDGEHIKSVLPSYMIDLHSLEQPLLNITELQFLHGYHQPTLMFLFEPVQTSTGRVAVRQDTFCVSAISLNMTEKVHPVIWSVTNLPFDCHMLRPIEKPIGGVLVFASNSLIYLNQSIPPYGVSLNSITEGSTMFPLKIQEDVVITLAESSCDAIATDQFILSLKGGEIYVLSLLSDGLRTVRSFHFEKAAGSVLASCVCWIEHGFVFLGSRLGNSLLLRYTEKDSASIAEKSKEAKVELPLSPKQKKRRLSITDEDLLLYGEYEEPTLSVITTYTFNVCDSLLNIGPITKAALGEPAFLSEEFFGSRQIDLEMVCCSGYGKNGTLTVLQRSIRPQVVTTFELPGCVNMWTVCGKSSKESVENYHSYLILSRDDSTMVLKTGAEITELDNSGFNVQQPTIFACNHLSNKYILQVCPQSIHLLEDTVQINSILLQDTIKITQCSISDPYVVMVDSTGQLIYLQVIEDSEGVQLKMNNIKTSNNGKISSICVYKDESGLFSVSNQIKDNSQAKKQSFLRERKRSTYIEDEEEFLYSTTSEETYEELSRRNSFSSSNNASMFPIVATYWCLVCTEYGRLEIYALPSFNLVFNSNNFYDAPKILVDSTVNNSITDEPYNQVKEILMVGAGYLRRRPFLYALIDQDLVVYECFSMCKQTFSGHLGVRFKKMEMNVLMRVKEEAKLAEMANPVKEKIKAPLLREVNNVASYDSGVFVCGAYPHWFFTTFRGEIHVHPLSIDGPITMFAPFNNVNCPKGFLYFNKIGELRIAVLPSHLNYDSPWPVRKVPLRMTPYEIAYLPDAKVYAVASSYTENQKKLPRFHTEEREFDTVEREPRYIYPQIERFVVSLISPTSWETVPNSRTVLQEFEHVTCMKVLLLHSELVDIGLKQYLVVGTTFNYGEDLACKGRILIFDVLEVVPEPGQPLTKTKCKCVYDKEQKGPVTAICATSGYIIAAVGQKIYAFKYKDNDLVGVAFVDSQVFTVNLMAIRNVIVAADISRSISLVRFQVEHKSLALVSRDTKTLEAYTSEFFIDGSQVGFVVSDAERNIVIFSYQPEALESFGGHRLLQKADINIGSHVNTMMRIKLIQDEQSLSKSSEQRQLIILPTLDGSIGILFPLSEKPFRRLTMLQNKLVDCLPHKAGLNPRAFRALDVPLRTLTNPHRNILDGQLLDKYAQLSFQERFDIAKKMGTTSGQILDDMMDIERASNHL